MASSVGLYVLVFAVTRGIFLPVAAVHKARHNDDSSESMLMRREQTKVIKEGDADGAKDGDAETRTDPVKQQLEQKSGKIAVLTSGTLKRYLLESAVSGLLAPLVSDGYVVDYFLSLSTADFHSHTPDGDQFVTDPQWPGETPLVEDLINRSVQSAGATPRHIELFEKLELNETIQTDFIEHAQINGKKSRRHMLRRFFKYGELKSMLEKQEEKSGAYDWVIMVDDDALWIQPMSFPRLLQAKEVKEFQCDDPDTISSSRAFNLKCQGQFNSTYDTGCDGLTEYVFILERKAAQTFMSQYNLLLYGAHDGISKQQPERFWTGNFAVWNVEKFARKIAVENQIKMVSVPAPLIPMNRGGRIMRDGKLEICLHKTCDSQSSEGGRLNPQQFHQRCAM